MPKLWLPHDEGERNEIAKRLRYEFNTFVPGWQTMDLSQLRDILTAEEEKAGRKKEPRPTPRFSRQEVGMALRDYRDFLQARKEGRKRIY